MRDVSPCLRPPPRCRFAAASPPCRLPRLPPSAPLPTYTSTPYVCCRGAALRQARRSHAARVAYVQPFFAERQRPPPCFEPFEHTPRRRCHQTTRQRHTRRFAQRQRQAKRSLHVERTRYPSTRRSRVRQITSTGYHHRIAKSAPVHACAWCVRKAGGARKKTKWRCAPPLSKVSRQIRKTCDALFYVAWPLIMSTPAATDPSVAHRIACRCHATRAGHRRTPSYTEFVYFFSAQIPRCMSTTASGFFSTPVVPRCVCYIHLMSADSLSITIRSLRRDAARLLMFGATTASAAPSCHD